MHAIASVAGCSVGTWSQDEDSIDTTLSAKRPNADISKVKIDVQLKCTSIETDPNQDHVRFVLPKKNYDDLRKPSSIPHILIVVYVPESHNDWISSSTSELLLKYAAFWINLQNPMLEDVENTHTVTIEIPTANLLTVEALNRMMDIMSQGAEP